MAMMKKDKIIKDLENVGYIKVDNDTWQYAKVGIKITFLKDGIVKISSPNTTYYNLWRLSDISVKKGYLEVRKSKDYCIKHLKGCKNLCDTCLAYEFQKR